LSDESIFREVDEEVRQEQLKRLWDKYGIIAIAACVGVIVAVGGIKGWQAYQASRAESAGARYLQAIDLVEEANIDEARVILDEIADGGPAGYAMLARFQTAQALADSGETDAAITLLDDIAASSGSSDLLGGLATLKSALLAVDTATYAQIEVKLGDLAVEEGPWLNSAREVLALAAYRTADYTQADRLYLEIRSDAQAPSGVVERARRMHELIEPYLQAMAAETDETGEGGEAATE
jgi:hypothetical protein